jgi:transposase
MAEAGLWLAVFNANKTSNPPAAIQLTVKSLLRRVQELAGFVIKCVRLNDCSQIEAELEAHPRRKARCSCCQRPAPGYDRLPQRRWQFVPLWQIPFVLIYAPRRVECSLCGIRVEYLPWSEGKHPYATAYRLFLARWARRLSWKETATIFKTSWDAVRRSVQWVVEWGLEHRSLEGVTALGIDELHWGRGKRSRNFVTLIYQIDADCRRLLWVGQRRTQATLKKGFELLEHSHNGFLQGLKVICSDMWKPYLAVIAKMAGDALNVLDPFHVAQHLNHAVDLVRRGESGRLRSAGKKLQIKRGRFLLLKRGTRVRGRARTKLQAMLRCLRQTARAWELKESFRQFWRYKSVLWAGAFLEVWTSAALRSRLEPIQKVARMLRSHEDLLLNYFRAKRQFTNAVTEGLNHKVRVSLARSYGHRSYEVLELVLYHRMANLPEPEFTHKFC